MSDIADERSRQLWAAFVLPVIALACDAADGYIARLDKRRQSLLGADLDSLADIVSFGVAPAVLGYTLGLRELWDVVCLTWFVCCGISRLARFNVTLASLTNTSPFFAVWISSVKASGGDGGSSWTGFFTPSPRYSSPAGAL